MQKPPQRAALVSRPCISTGKGTLPGDVKALRSCWGCSLVDTLSTPRYTRTVDLGRSPRPFSSLGGFWTAEVSARTRGHHPGPEHSPVTTPCGVQEVAHGHRHLHLG